MIEAKLFHQVFDSKIILISGITRSGKALVSGLVSTFSQVDKVVVDSALETVPILHRLGKITTDAATYLLKFKVNINIYNEYIGRGMNLRPGDFTSIFNYSDPQEYFSRLARKEGQNLSNELNEANRQFLFLTHYALLNPILWLDVSKELRIVDVKRNPVDLVFAWLRKDYCNNTYSTPRNLTPAVIHNDVVVPHFSVGWEEEYLESSQVDRIIKTIAYCHKESEDNNASLVERGLADRVLSIYFEEIIIDTDRSLDNLARFLGTATSERTRWGYKKEQIPRDLVIVNEEREKKFNKIASLASAECLQQLVALCATYDNVAPRREA